VNVEQIISGSSVAGRHRRWLGVQSGDLVAAASALLASGYRLALVAAHDDVGSLRIVYLFTASGPDRRVELIVTVDPDRPVVPSLVGVSFAGSRFEREMRDLFGVTPSGHPELRRLVAHQHWPDGWFPMRRGAGPAPAMYDEGHPYPFLMVEGEGIYEIPVGPVHAGLIEPGHFRFSAVGETILRMKSRLWFVHKGIERLFEGREPSDGIELAERISGDTAVGHTLAFCLAVEDALEWDVPNDVQLLRSILLELERIYNHTTDIGALCNDVAYGIIHAHCMRLRESMLRLNADVTGHRLLRGGVHLGGATVRRLPSVGEIDHLRSELAEIVRLALANNVVADRFAGTAVLPGDVARAYGTLGYVARASGVRIDARHDHPFADDGDARPQMVVQEAGDVMARFLARSEEAATSFGVLQALVPRVNTPQASTSHPQRSNPRSGVGIAEGWRGTIVHRVEIDARGCLSRVKVVDPSFMNWPALTEALVDTIVPDFPLANKSFNLSYAGNDL
jgi:Ni,Fe-hydrogenase III large subunit/Ni,Fe-hydrogenase III component G